MLRADTIIMSIAAALGLLVTVWHILGTGGEDRRGPPWPAGLLHGVVGVAGLAVFLLVLRTPREELLQEADKIGVNAVATLAVATLIGIAYPVLARRRVPFAPAAMMLHILVAVVGFVLFLAWMSVN